ncbi:MAG: DUF3137 domain-containing protein [Bacilli bacterium]|nr:DUF3137 domain-containing protein [Bacilli bacterium]
MFPYIFIFIYLGIFIVILVSIFTSKSKKVKINVEESEKYKNDAYKLIANNEKLSEQRKKHNFLSAIKGALLIALFASFCFLHTLGYFAVYIIIAFAIILVILIFKGEKDNVIFDEIIPSILKDNYKDLKYDHKVGISSSIYREARFEGYDRYHSDDYMEGKVCGYDFIMSEVHTERRHTDKDGHTHYTTIFHGTFSKVTLDKSLDCFINICNNRIKLFSRDKYITIDNEAFEKIYDVFTDDKIKAMRLLTPDVTSKMIDLYNETGIYCEVKIHNNLLYIRLYTGALFNFSFSNPEKEAIMVGKSLAVIDSVLKIMENFIKEIEEFDV